LASVRELQQIFTECQQHEQNHLTTLNQILTDGVYKKPAGSTGASSGGSSSGMTQSASSGGAQSAKTPAQYKGDFEKDKYLCTDSLSMEKYVSGVYDTAIFEFVNTKNRDALNFIQKQEQQHGQKIYAYMAKNGMY
jgi:spore coat protein CotF